MKKLFLFIAVWFFSYTLSFAGKIEKMWDFTVNDEGECIIEKVFSTKKDNVEALKAFKIVINRQTFEDRSVESETAGEFIKYKLTKNTKTRFNPFAGNFNESMSFRMDVFPDNGKVYVKIYDLTLNNEYEGYGKRKSSDSFSGKIIEYEEAQRTSSNSKGKEKKEAQEVMETINDSFNQCHEELYKIFLQIQKSL